LVGGDAWPVMLCSWDGDFASGRLLMNTSECLT